jgi:hypothetical protein
VLVVRTTPIIVSPRSHASDGAGHIDQLGAGVSPEWLGRPLWWYGAQSYRVFGTADEFTVVPLRLVVPLPENVAMDHATNVSAPTIPVWPMVFKNMRLFFPGSDDFSEEDKIRATHDPNAALDGGWSGFEIAERVPLSEIARAHELVEHPTRRGRVVVKL